MANEKFQNALHRKIQSCPPVWMMRQAGRYHSHYQKLRARHSFMELCKNPELAAQVALGPIQDFDFDVAILFSDLLFPLEGLGMGLSYGDSGPKLEWSLNEKTLSRLAGVDQALEGLLFQKEAVRLTRQALAPNKSLVGFVGGPWTLFSYAVQGQHEGNEAQARRELFPAFCKKMIPLLVANIQLQLNSGAEIVMIFDTAAGNLTPVEFSDVAISETVKLAEAHPGRLAYYSKNTTKKHLDHSVLKGAPWAGFGVDQNWNLEKEFSFFGHGFIQGNFDQNILKTAAPGEFKALLTQYLKPLRNLSPEKRAGWVCGLGHGILPQTPESNVRTFVHTVREIFS